jgi:hypothetical protein
VNNMSISYLQFLAAIIILSCIFMYGIGNKSPDNSAQSPTVMKSSEGTNSSDKKNAHTKSKTPAHQPHPMVKPGAAVSLKSTEPLYAPAPGVYEYQLQLVSPNHTGSMTINVTTDDGVTIVSPEHRFEFVLQEGGEYKLPLTLNAGAEGRFYIQLQVSTVVAGQTSMRAITAILQVGAPMGKMQKTMTNGSAGKSDSVISLPAQETISPR